MKKFSFRLQRLLDLAQRRSDLARIELGQALATLQSVEAEEIAAKRRIRAAQEEISLICRGRVLSPTQLELHHDCLAVEEQKLRMTTLRKQAAEELFFSAKETMLERRREVIALEKAKANALEAWQAEWQKNEAEFLDEVAASRHVRGRQERDVK